MSADRTTRITSDLTREDAETVRGLVQAVDEAWKAIPDADDRDYATLADAVNALVKQRDEARFTTDGDAHNKIAELTANLTRAWLAIPRDVAGNNDELADAITELVAQRDQAREQRTRARADADEYGTYIDRLWNRVGEGDDWTLDDLTNALDAAIQPSTAANAATSALWEARAYAIRRLETGMTNGQVLSHLMGWLDRAIDGGAA